VVAKVPPHFSMRVKDNLRTISAMQSPGWAAAATARAEHVSKIISMAVLVAAENVPVARF
jgi:hypothetical protein